MGGEAVKGRVLAERHQDAEKEREGQPSSFGVPSYEEEGEEDEPDNGEGGLGLVEMIHAPVIPLAVIVIGSEEAREDERAKIPWGPRMEIEVDVHPVSEGIRVEEEALKGVQKARTGKEGREGSGRDEEGEPAVP
jgi:hypothetical protein